MFLWFHLLLSRLKSQLLLLILFLLLNALPGFRLLSVWKDYGEHSSLSHLSTLLPILYQVWYWQQKFFYSPFFLPSMASSTDSYFLNFLSIECLLFLSLPFNNFLVFIEETHWLRAFFLFFGASIFFNNDGTIFFLIFLTTSFFLFLLPFDYKIKKIKFLWFKMISNLIFNF